MEVWRSPWSVGSAAPRACSVSGAGWAVSWEKKKKAYVPKPYQQMTYPGQRVQMDVKVGPRCCITDPELRLFQYTAINEFARLRFLAAYPEQSSYSSADFLKRLVRRYASRDIRIECVQIDNGFEFTNRFSNSKWDLQAFLRKLPLSRASATSSFVHTRPDIMARWNAATGRTRNVSIPVTPFSLYSILISSSLSTIAAPTTRR